MANSGLNTNDGGQTHARRGLRSTKHSVFGEVVEGLDVVTNISHAFQQARERPQEMPTVESVTIRKQ